MQDTNSDISYKPGQCNIGPEEIDRRLRNGYLGLAGMAIFIIVDLNFHLPQIWKLVLFAPTAYAVSGFLQAKQKFCFIYGFMGLSSITGSRIFTKSKDNQLLSKDRSKAWFLVFQIFIASALVTLAYYYLS